MQVAGVDEHAGPRNAGEASEGAVGEVQRRQAAGLARSGARDGAGEGKGGFEREE